MRVSLNYLAGLPQLPGDPSCTSACTVLPVFGLFEPFGLVSLPIEQAGPQVREALGITYVRDVLGHEGNFAVYRLPQWWRKVYIGQRGPRMALTDEQQHVRATIYAEEIAGAWRAHMRWLPRYSVGPVARPVADKLQLCIWDGRRTDLPLHEFRPYGLPSGGADRQTVRQRAYREARRALGERFPGHANVLAYW